MVRHKYGYTQFNLEIREKNTAFVKKINLFKKNKKQNISKTRKSSCLQLSDFVIFSLKMKFRDRDRVGAIFFEF